MGMPATAAVVAISTSCSIPLLTRCMPSPSCPPHGPPLLPLQLRRQCDSYCHAFVTLLSLLPHLTPTTAPYQGNYTRTGISCAYTCYHSHIRSGWRSPA